jgi:hypothetical protein
MEKKRERYIFACCEAMIAVPPINSFTLKGKTVLRYKVKKRLDLDYPSVFH